MKRTICLNADLGELEGDAGRDLDRAMLDVVSRCNIACGGHAGDDQTMLLTIHAAQARGVLIGAHPSYPDKASFGRKRPDMALDALEASLVGQVRSLVALARERGATVAHLKPHGSLYNDAAVDPALADLVVKVCRRCGIHALIGPPDSCLETSAAKHSLRYIAEGFVDRAYEADGTLTPRSQTGAVLETDEARIAQAMGFIESGSVTARTGQVIPLVVETLCLHGDTPGAANSAFKLRDALRVRDIDIRPSPAP